MRSLGQSSGFFERTLVWTLHWQEYDRNVPTRLLTFLLYSTYMPTPTTCLGSLFAVPIRVLFTVVAFWGLAGNKGTYYVGSM